MRSVVSTDVKEDRAMSGMRPDGRDMAVLADAIEACLSGSEGGFLALGHSLEAIVNHSRSLHEQAEGLSATLGKGEGAAILDQLGRIVTDPAREQGRIRELLSQKLALIERISADIGGLPRAAAALDTLVNRMRIIALNTLITSTRAGGSTERIAIFAADVRTLADRLDQLRTDFSRQASQSAEEQLRQRAALVLRIDETNRIAREEDAAAGRTLEAVRSLGAGVRTTLEDVLGYTNTLSGHSMTIITDLQIHDIVRQRIEHIVRALRQAPDNPAVCALQHAQMQDTVSQLGQTIPRIRASFGAIGEALRSLSTRLAADDMQAMLRALDLMKESLTGIRNLSARQNASIGDLAEMRDELSETAAAMAGFSERIRLANDDLRLKAFNALIMTTHLGEQGRGFGVLAREVQTISADTRAFVSAVSETIDRISSDTAGSAEMQAAGLSQNADPALDTLRRLVADGMNEILGEAGCLSGAITAALEESAVIEKLGSDLEEGCTRLAACLGGGITLTGKESLHGEESYTMDSERAVHRSFSGLEAASTVGSGSIELF